MPNPQFQPPTLADAWRAGNLPLADARALAVKRRNGRWEPMALLAEPGDGDSGWTGEPERVRPYDASLLVRCPKTGRACRPDQMYDVRAIPNAKIDGDFVDVHWVGEHHRDGRVEPSEFLQLMGAPAAAVTHARANRDRPGSRRARP